jgi:hypothetical protein
MNKLINIIKTDGLPDIISEMININELKKELSLTNTDIAGFFGLSPMAYANSSAKKRYEEALCRFYEHIKSMDVSSVLNGR